MDAGAGAGGQARRNHAAPPSRLRQRVGIVSAAAMLLGSVPLLRALQPPAAPAPATSVAGRPESRPNLGDLSLAAGGGRSREGESASNTPDAVPGGPTVLGGVPEGMKRALERMTEESASRPRVYALLEDAPTDRAVAMLLTAAGIRFRIEGNVRGRVTFRPSRGSGSASEALLHICRQNTGPRLDVVHERDTYVVRVSDSGTAAAPPAAAGVPAPSSPAPAANNAGRGGDVRRAAADAPASGAPPVLLPLEADGTVRRVAGVVVAGRMPVVALLETIPAGGNAFFEMVRAGERVEPGVDGNEPLRAESVQVDGILVRTMKGDGFHVPLAPQATPIARATRRSRREAGFPPRPTMGTDPWPRGGGGDGMRGGNGFWEQETGGRYGGARSSF